MKAAQYREIGAAPEVVTVPTRNRTPDRCC